MIRRHAAAMRALTAALLIFPLAILTACESDGASAKPPDAQPVEAVAKAEGSAGSKAPELQTEASTSAPASIEGVELSPPQGVSEAEALAEALALFPSPKDRVALSKAQWKKVLTDDEFYILREQGTERAYTSDLLNNKSPGIYTCAACGAPLFSSATKFKSGTGWPSFYTPIQPERVAERADNSLGMRRTEVVCQRCDGHLGHVFNDGPKPTGLRYCINGVSLDFVEAPVE